MNPTSVRSCAALAGILAHLPDEVAVTAAEFDWRGEIRIRHGDAVTGEALADAIGLTGREQTTETTSLVGRTRVWHRILRTGTYAGHSVTVAIQWSTDPIDEPDRAEVDGE